MGFTKKENNMTDEENIRLIMRAGSLLEELFTDILILGVAEDGRMTHTSTGSSDKLIALMEIAEGKVRLESIS